MYYTKNLTENKYEIFFDSISEHDSLPNEKKERLGQYCRFISGIGGWRSKAKILNAWQVERLIKDLNIEYLGEEGEKRSFAEQVEAKKGKAAEDDNYKDVAYLGKRIIECETDIRSCERRLKGKTSASEPISEDEARGWNEKLEEAKDKLAYLECCLQQCQENGTIIFDKNSLEGKTEVLIKKSWRTVVKLSRKNIYVRNTAFSGELQVKYARPYGFHEVKAAR